ncbi:MAG: energy-coupling factor ABC transporter ATP-binding protein [Planctomycetota bacterium]
MSEDVPPALETRGLTFTYQEGTEALTEVDFRVADGEFVAILASNGSGKTTLLKILMNVLHADVGEVMMGGRNVDEIPGAELYQRAGLVLQDPNDQLFAPTVGEDVAFGPRNLELDEEEVQGRVEEALDAVGGIHLRERAIHHLSFGERKRVCMAGVLAMRPSILILDEPTAGLDPAGEDEMLHLLHSLNAERGITVVLATHSVDLLPLFTDRIYVLNNGRVMREGPSEEIFTDHRMVEEASLRLPYISRLLHEMKNEDGVPIEGLPLTVREARMRLVDLIPADIIADQLEEE